ncbi:MAG: tyrosine-type recombinase/integrase [Firmicutes bacterium]|nr:tyrosine-type recombinase/integrase [Bacillota bacterium]
MVRAMELLEKYEKKQLNKKSENTVKAYITDLKHFNSFLVSRGKRFDGVTNKDIETYIEFLLSQKNKITKNLIKPKTVNRKLVSIRKYINFLNAAEEYQGNIFVEIELLKVQDQYYLDNLLSKKEYDRMLERAIQENDKKAYVIFNALYYTGTRVSELLQIKAEHINNDNLTVCGKGEKYREIILSETIINILRDYIYRNEIKPEDILFKMTRQNIHKIIKEYAGKCRIKLVKAHAHNFRHLCAFRLIGGGASIEEVADFMGHSNINTTRIYTRKTKSELRKTLNNL